MNVIDRIGDYLALVLVSIIALLSASHSHAASFLAPNTTYDLSIRTGTSCFVNGTPFNDCSGSNPSAIYTDNGLVATDPVTGETIGLSIEGDGWAGTIRFTTDTSGEGFSVQSFNQDGFELLPTFNAPNTVVLADDVTQMYGYIDAAGNMSFVPVSRQAFMINFAFFGVQDFMFDNSVFLGSAATNGWIPLTTGTSSRPDRADYESAYSLTGVPFTSDGAGGFDGVLVSVGYYGDGWSIASGTPYVEIWDAHITTVVPIPAAAWLFASGILGLAGLQRRRKAV